MIAVTSTLRVWLPRQVSVMNLSTHVIQNMTRRGFEALARLTGLRKLTLVNSSTVSSAGAFPETPRLVLCLKTARHQSDLLATLSMVLDEPTVTQGRVCVWSKPIPEPQALCDPSTAGCVE